MTRPRRSAAPVRMRGGLREGSDLSRCSPQRCSPSQEPLCGPAAQKLGAVQFVLINQIALTLAAPFLLVGGAGAAGLSGRFFKSPAGADIWRAWWASGLRARALQSRPQPRASGRGLGDTQPVAVLGRDGRARAFGRAHSGGACDIRARPGVGVRGQPWRSPTASHGCDGVAALLKGSWYFAIPVPIFTALSGSLIEVWFKKCARFRRDRRVASVLGRLDDPGLCALSLAVGRGLQHRLAAGGDDDDRRDPRLGDRAAVLSARLARHRRRQWLRDHVLPARAGAGGRLFLGAVDVDAGAEVSPNPIISSASASPPRRCSISRGAPVRADGRLALAPAAQPFLPGGVSACELLPCERL